jgi:tRNA CCA-adding enzyme
MHPLLTIRNQVLPLLRPTQADKDRVRSCFSTIEQAVSHVAQERKVQIAFVRLEGSAGRKQTQLRSNPDLDVFIGLPSSTLPGIRGTGRPAKSTVQKLLKGLVRDVGLEAASMAGCQNIKVAYAEHPYVTATFDEFQVDVVFCFDLSPEYISERGPITAVDRTPHHSRFVDEHLSIDQRDDVRLLKAFFQACWVYGDASPIGRSGFTGFTAEMLIYHRQNIVSALELLENPPAEPLDYFGRPATSLREAFPNDLLIIVDPTDRTRNVAASISERAYQYARHQAAQTLQHPSRRFFLPRAIPVLSPEKEAHLEPNYLVVEHKDETGWHYTKTRDKIYRYFTHLCHFLKSEQTGELRFGPSTFEEVFEKDVFAVALHVASPFISPSYTRVGPPPHLDDAVRRFRNTHPSAYLRNGRYQVEISRSYSVAEEAVKGYLAQYPVAQKLHRVAVTRAGTTLTGKRALWILKNGILPFLGDQI